MNILAIGAHPDDLEFGCGGTLHHLSQSGARIHLLIASCGEKGGDQDVRRHEQERVAEALKAHLIWGGFQDSQIPINRALIETIESKIQSIRPEIVFTHHRDDSHQDHRAIAQATITATRYIHDILFFEGPTTHDFHPTVFMDIEPSLPAKLKLLSSHKSQIHKTNIAGLSILEMAKSTAVFRGTQYRVKYAEGFMPQRFSLDGRFLRRPWR